MFEFRAGGPAGSLTESAIRGEGKAVGGRVLETGTNARRDIGNGLDVIAFYIDDADRHIDLFRDVSDDGQLAELSAGHLDVDFVEGHVEERGEHGGVLPEADGVAFEVTEAEVGGEPAFPDDGFDGSVEDIDEAFGILAMGVAAHGGFIDGDFTATGGDEVFQFSSDDGQESFREGPAIGVLFIGYEASAERIGSGDGGLEGWAGGIGAEAGCGDALESFKILNCSEATGSADFACDVMSAALVVGRGAEASGGCAFQVDALEKPIEGQIEVQAGLFTIGDHIETGRDLVVQGDGDGIIDEFCAVGGSEFVEGAAGKLEPSREGVAADNGGAQGSFFHGQ